MRDQSRWPYAPIRCAANVAIYSAEYTLIGPSIFKRATTIRSVRSDMDMDMDMYMGKYADVYICTYTMCHYNKPNERKYIGEKTLAQAPSQYGVLKSSLQL